jgi:4-hydroxybenzoate polyprenyltransferase
VLAWHTKAEGFSWIELAGILLCMVFARSAAMAFNRLADRRLDAANPRTAGRHLPSGQLSVPAVWLFTVVCAVAFVASTFLFLLAQPANPWPVCLSLPVLVFIAAYSYTKRFTSLAHFWLGASLLLSPVAAWIAIRAFEDIQIAVVIGLAVFFWVAGFDIIYACQDVDYDRRVRLKSIPARLGVRGALRVAFVCHLLMIVMLAVLYLVAAPPLGNIYLAGVAAVLLLLLYEHYLVSPNDLSRVNQAFFHVNAVVSIGLFTVVLVEVWVRR